MMVATLSLCHNCYQEIPAELFTLNNELWIRKKCPKHGISEHLCENNAAFWAAQSINDLNDPSIYLNTMYNNTVLIEVTNLCNMRCPACCNLPKAEPSTQLIIQKALQLPFSNILLSGGEPTLRKDLETIIRELTVRKKLVGIFTNGQTMTAAAIEKLKTAGLQYLCISVHTPSYWGEEAFIKAQNTVKLCIFHKIRLAQISFTLTTISELKTIVNTIQAIHSQKPEVNDYCIRASKEIGTSTKSAAAKIFTSDIIQGLSEYGQTDIIKDQGNTPYHCRVLFNNIPIQVISWPTSKNVDLRFLQHAPYASLIDNTYGNFVLQYLLKEGLALGWFNGEKITSHKKAVPTPFKHFKRGTT